MADPNIVQGPVTDPTTTSGAISLAATGAGNTVVVAWALCKSNSNPTAVSVTLTGAGTMTSAVQLGSSADWAFVGISYVSTGSGGQTGITFSLTGGSGTEEVLAWAWELEGAWTPDAGKSNSKAMTSSGSTWTSNATGTLSAATDYVFGIVGTFPNDKTSRTLKPPTTGGWVPTSQGTIASNQGVAIAGYNPVGATTSISWSNGSGQASLPGYNAAIAAFSAPAAAPPPPAGSAPLHSTFYDQGDTSSKTIAVPIPATTAGSTLILFCSGGDNDEDIASISPGTWTRRFLDDATDAVSVWDSTNVAAGTASITVTLAAVDTLNQFIIDEWAGTLSFQGNSAATDEPGATTSWSSSGYTTTVAKSVVYGYLTGFTLAGSADMTATPSSSAWVSTGGGFQLGDNAVFSFAGYQTPAAVGSFTFGGASTISANNYDYTAAVLAWTVGAAAPLTISAPSSQTSTVGVAVGVTPATASGGVPPYTYSIGSGALPAGLTINGSTGTVTGAPTTAQTATPLTIKVTDSSGSTATSSSFTWTVPNPLTITSESLPAGTAGTAYSATLVAADGVTPYTWSLQGTPPPGLALSSSGVLSGTPTTPGSYSFAVTVTDSAVVMPVGVPSSLVGALVLDANGAALLAWPHVEVGSDQSGGGTYGTDANGNLTLTTNGTGSNSAEVQSPGTYTFGIFEAMFMLPDDGSGGLAAWPAWWLTGSGTWPTTGEIDIVEILDGGSSYNFHYGTAASPQQTGPTFPYDLTPDVWHTASCVWQSGSIAWYWDGALVSTYTSPNVTSAPMTMLLDITTDPDSTVDYNSTLTVQYVRAWNLA